MPEDLAGRVALVTGAARGLGRATALALLAGGAAVAVNVRRAEQAAAVAGDLAAAIAEGLAHPGAATGAAPPPRAPAGPGAAAAPPDRVLVVPGDVADAATVRQIVERARDRFGRLDILVNNAALARATRFEQISEEEWRRTMDVNLTAAFLCIRAVLPAMKEAGYGRVVNLSSTAGKSVSTLGGAHYTASKAGLLGLTRAAAKELGRYGITVNAVCPGLIDTELTREHATAEELERHARGFPIQRLGTAQEVADLVCFLASERAGYITGASLDINGGDLMI
jgi:NAD(P)-dependent dehydrogenase (short-subunit alcohol dehydrogenase family)